MSSVGVAYNSLLPQLSELEKQARDVLTLYTQREGFLLAHRIKSFEAVLDKLETGRYRKISEFDDLVAFTVIIDTRSQHAEVLGFLKRTFKIEIVKGKSTLTDERMFDFDATRVYARLIVSDPMSSISEITFEIQIRTLLQHAWSKITHPLVYKAPKVNAQGIRLAAEILATMEGLDRSLSTFATVSRGVKRVDRVRSSRLNILVSMVDELVQAGIVPAEIRPKNGRRFAENLISLIEDTNVKFDQAVSVLRSFYQEQSATFPYSVTLQQLAMVAFLRAGILKSTNRKRLRYSYVTAEMISLFPDAVSISPIVEI